MEPAIFRSGADGPAGELQDSWSFAGAGHGEGYHPLVKNLLLDVRGHSVAARSDERCPGEPVTMAAEATRCTSTEDLFRCGLECLPVFGTRVPHPSMREGPRQAHRTASRRSLHLPCNSPALRFGGRG
jgi:hypothetical protein